MQIVLNENHEYFVDGVQYPSVTQVLGAAGVYGDSMRFYDERSRIRGKNVHRIIELHLKGILDKKTVDKRLKGYYDAFQKFEAENEVVANEVEKVVCNSGLMVAGTVDFIGKLNGEPVIIDFKTGVPVPATALQLAGYKVLIGGWTERFRRAALYLKNDGNYRLNYYTNDADDKEVFLSACALYWWRKKYNMLKKVMK